MARYRCHKEVDAFRIDAIDFNADSGAKISSQGSLIIEANFRDKFKGDEGNLGYIVYYDDGYVSWSPAKAFEDGYTKIKG